MWTQQGGVYTCLPFCDHAELLAASKDHAAKAVPPKTFKSALVPADVCGDNVGTVGRSDENEAVRCAERRAAEMVAEAKMRSEAAKAEARWRRALDACR